MSSTSTIARRFVLIALSGMTALPLWAGTPKPVRLLTVGNSFSRNATRFLPALAKAGGHELVHKAIVVGGASLELHAEKARLHELDSADQGGLYSDGSSLKQVLAAQPWDFVTIQQASIKSHDLSTYQPYARRLRDLIQQHAPAAKLLVHQTWAYRRDDPRFVKPSDKPGEPATQSAMYEGLNQAYQTVAADLGAALIPVGDAFYAVDTHDKWRFTTDESFDFKNAKYPALPAQAHSLHTGWRWLKQKDGSTSLRMDGHHANMAGEYLGGCVWYEVIFRASVVGNTFVPPEIEPAFGRFLQEVAHRAVQNSRAGEAGGIPAAPSAKLRDAVK